MDDIFLYTPKYFDMLISSAGLLSGEKRYRRVVEIGTKNIWLAAKCKNTCVKEETEIVDWIIRRSSLLYGKFGDLQSLVALFELREYGVLGYLLGLINKNGELNKIVVKLLNNRTNFSDAFSEIVELLDFSFGHKLFHRFVELGYVFDVQAYNKLIAMAKSAEDVRELIGMMTSSGIEANAITYFHLLRREKTYNSSLIYFDLFKKDVDFINQRDLVEEVYDVMSKKCDNYDDLQLLYNDYMSHYPGENSLCRFNESYYGATIIVSNNEEEAKSIFESRATNLLEQIRGDIENPSVKRAKIKRKKNLISSLSSYYIQRLSQSSIPYEIFINTLKYLINLIVVQLNVRVPRLDYSKSITKMIAREGSFTKGKELIELMHYHRQRVLPFCLERLLCLAKAKEEIDFVINNVKCKKISPQIVVSFINRADIEIAMYLFELLKERGYTMNVYIYNAIIKGATFQHSLYLIEQMQMNGISPDIQTIQPLLRKWDSISDLANIILLATKLKVDADERTIHAILKRATELKIESDLIDFSYEDSRMKNDLFASSWQQSIVKACNVII